MGRYDDLGHGDAAHGASSSADVDPPPDAPRALPDDWWDTEQLRCIANVADDFDVSREALLLACLVNVSMHIPYWRVIGGRRRVPPNLIVVFVGNPGDGKGTVLDLADVLLPPRDDVRQARLATAQGFASCFYNDDRAEKALMRHFRPVRMRCDEINDFVGKTSTGAGASAHQLVAELKSAAFGERLGADFKNQANRLTVEALSYRFGMTISAAPAKSSGLFEDQGGGLPERFVFARVLPPDIDLDADRPPANLSVVARMDWSCPYLDRPELATAASEIELDLAVQLDVERRIRARKVASNRGLADPNGLSEHRDLNVLKLAVHIAALHGSCRVGVPSWERANALMGTSDAALGYLRHGVREEAQRSQRASERAHAGRVVAAIKATARHETEQYEEARDQLLEIVRQGDGKGGHVTARDAAKILPEPYRNAAHRDSLIEHLVGDGLIEVREIPTTAGGSKRKELRIAGGGEVQPHSAAAPQRRTEEHLND